MMPIYRIDDLANAIDTILNLIEKQSEEIEELNKSDASKEQSSIKYYNLYKELVDKIKVKIEELQDYIQENTDGLGYWGNVSQEEIYNKIEILEELLEED